MFEITYPGTNDTIRGIVVTALRKLKSKSYLDISIIKDLADLMGVTLSKNTKTILSLLHCVDYSDIDHAALEYVSSLLTAILKGKDI